MSSRIRYEELGGREQPGRASADDQDVVPGHAITYRDGGSPRRISRKQSLAVSDEQKAAVLGGTVMKLLGIKA